MTETTEHEEVEYVEDEANEPAPESAEDATAEDETAEAKPKKPKKEPKPPRPEQNGIKRPSDGTQTGRVWDIADAISKQKGEPATRIEVVNACSEEEINTSTAATQYGKWRKFFGLIGEKSPGRGASPASEGDASGNAADATVSEGDTSEESAASETEQEAEA